MELATTAALPLIASAATALAAFAAAASAARAAFGPPARLGLAPGFERSRRDLLAGRNQTYRTFESLAERLAAWDARRIPPEARERLARDLPAADPLVPWKPSEYRAVKAVESGLVGLFAGGVAALLSGSPIFAAILGPAAGLATFQLAMGDLSSRIARREASIRKALPYMIDLMALMMEAGASFPEALAVAVGEFRGTPVGDEWGRVLSDVERGRTRREALEALRDRIRSDDVAEVVFAVNKGEELGTPLGRILKAQAEQLRVKRSQWIEKASAEAEVKIAVPGLITMIACLIVVAVPFLLQGFTAIFKE